MGWKDWPYWLKGGTLGAVILLVCRIILFVIDKIMDLSFQSYQLYKIVMLEGLPAIFMVPFTMLCYLINRAAGICTAKVLIVATFVILSILTGFIWGSLIGLVIGKIKSR